MPVAAMYKIFAVQRRHDRTRYKSGIVTYTCKNGVSRTYTNTVLQYATNIATFCAAVCRITALNVMIAAQNRLCRLPA